MPDDAPMLGGQPPADDSPALGGALSQWPIRLDGTERKLRDITLHCHVPSVAEADHIWQSICRAQPVMLVRSDGTVVIFIPMPAEGHSFFTLPRDDHLAIIAEFRFTGTYMMVEKPADSIRTEPECYRPTLINWNVSLVANGDPPMRFRTPSPPPLNRQSGPE